MRVFLRTGKAMYIAIAALFCTTAFTIPDGARVQADKPTVVTVREKTERVETREARQERRVRKTAVRRLGLLAGWALNVSDDIPSARERAKTAR
jgi:hypothetical protein